MYHNIKISYKLVVVNKKDLYQFDRLIGCCKNNHEVKIVEDFSELDAENVSDDIAENTQIQLHF